jgi:hypothetical protein
MKYVFTRMNLLGKRINKAHTSLKPEISRRLEIDVDQINSHYEDSHGLLTINCGPH